MPESAPKLMSVRNRKRLNASLMPIVGEVLVVEVVVVVEVLVVVVEVEGPENRHTAAWCGSDRVASSGAKKLKPNCLDGGAVHLGELHLQQNFLAPTGPKVNTLTTFFE